jgi:fatty-acyl-CoA synthase
METVAEVLIARSQDNRPALYFEDRRWSGAELVAESAARARYLLARRTPGLFHVGLLLDNIPEYAFWVGACALAGATFVALNSTRKGADLARDIVHTECRFVLTESRYREQVPDDTAAALGNGLIMVDAPGYEAILADHRGLPPPQTEVSPRDISCLIFTSGTSGAPKAVIYSNVRVVRNCMMLVQSQQLTAQDVSYVPMPLFHSTGLIMGLLPLLAAGGAVVLRRKFSASGFLPDIRKFGVTSFCYVGKPLAYILATEEKPDDRDNSLRVVFGSEATDVDIANFSRRFGCPVIDNYGSSEGCITILRSKDTPPGSIGRGVSEQIRAMNPETGMECPRAVLDAHGVLQNGNEAIGELVNLDGEVIFEGYWNHPAAREQRIRNGAYWSGDLAYRDAAGFFYFAGRNSEWLRVDGENLSTIQIEQVLARHPGIAVAAVYGVPDPLVGDQVMAALELTPGSRLDMAEFSTFLATQKDFGSKWIPAFIRISERLPTTQTNKVLKRNLKQEAWHCADPVWWRPAREAPYQLLTAADREALRHLFVSRGRGHLLPQEE